MPHAHDDLARSSTTGGLPVAPTLGPALDAAGMPPQPSLVTRRTFVVCAMAVILAVAAAVVAQSLTRLIALITNVAFYGRFSSAAVSPAGNKLGLAVILVPVAGSIVVGMMARWGSQAIRGHGIPEAMERVLEHGSRIPARITFLKPLSAAIAIGTGGPFGAEGPIIATGGALGSLIGQALHTTSHERKTLLAAGAAAGMSATFGSPVSAVLLAIELLLFELSPRSLLPVSLATAVAAGVRIAWSGGAPVFPMPALLQPSGSALAVYIAIGAVVGLASVGITRAVYAVEDAFEKLPMHWMWWPALGAIVVGVVGWIEPRTMGVGYDNIERIVSGQLLGRAMIALCALKFVSWVISLGSGTSGGTLAPLFTMGGGLGAALATLATSAVPTWGVDPRIGALVGMAALFAGASRALLASVVFAFETTRQPLGLLPLLGGCTASFLVSAFFMRESIMTTKIARRGVRVPVEFGPDALDHTRVGDCATRDVVSLRADETVATALAQLASDQRAHGRLGFPVLDATGLLVGVVTRTRLAAHPDGGALVGGIVDRAAVVAFVDSTLREAMETMAVEDVGRLPVVARESPRVVLGMLTRSDLVRAYGEHLQGHRRVERHLRLRWPRRALR